MVDSLRFLVVATQVEITSGHEVSWFTQGNLLWIMTLMTLAVAVFIVGKRAAKQHTGRRGPRFRDRIFARGLDFDLAIARLESEPLSMSNTAVVGQPVRLRLRILQASGNLGGAAGRERIWHNRAHASRATAVAADWASARDAGGEVLLVGLGRARVIAPFEENPRGFSTVSLCLGDEVEVLGIFEGVAVLERLDLEPAYPGDRAQLSGVVGAGRQLQVRVMSRAGVATSGEDPSATPTS